MLMIRPSLFFFFLNFVKLRLHFWICLPGWSVTTMSHWLLGYYCHQSQESTGIFSLWLCGISTLRTAKGYYCTGMRTRCACWVASCTKSQKLKSAIFRCPYMGWPLTDLHSEAIDHLFNWETFDSLLKWKLLLNYLLTSRCPYIRAGWLPCTNRRSCTGYRGYVLAVRLRSRCALVWCLPVTHNRSSEPERGSVYVNKQIPILTGK